METAVMELLEMDLAFVNLVLLDHFVLIVLLVFLVITVPFVLVVWVELVTITPLVMESVIVLQDLMELFVIIVPQIDSVLTALFVDV